MISLFGYTLNISEAFNTTYARLISFYVSNYSLVSIELLFDE